MLPPRPAVLRRRFCLMVFCLADEGAYGDAVLRGVAGVGTGRVSAALVVLRCTPTHQCHTRERVSSTPRLFNSIISVSGILGRPLKPGDDTGAMTTDTPSRSRGSICPRLAIEFPYPPNQRAQGMPGARCTRGLVCNSVERRRTRAYRAAEASDIPCAMALRLISCSPRSGRARCHRRRADLASANLTPASGRQDHTTSPYASAPFVKGTSASTASHPALVTIAKRPSYRDGTNRYIADLGLSSSKIRKIRNAVGAAQRDRISMTL